MKQLSPFDSFFVYQETSTKPLHISPIIIYDPPEEGEEPVRFKDILNRFQERIAASPVFRRKLVKVPFGLDSPYWIDDSDFDLEFHVRHLALPKPGDWRQFCILLARLHSRQLDLSRPPWEAYVIEGMDNINGLPSGSFCLYLKIHHSAIDGATGNMIIEALHDSVPDPDSPPVKHDRWRGESRPGDVKLLGKAYINAIRSPLKAIDIVRHARKSRRKTIRGAYDENLSHEFKNKLRFNEAIPSASRVFGGLRVELSDIKAIKNAAGKCTVNDVVLGIIGGAMRNYLMASDELPDESLLAAIPISTRPPEKFNTEGGNMVSGMRLFLRTDVGDPIKRIQLIHEDAVATKAYSNAIGVERIQTIVESIPASIASLGMRTLAQTGLGARAPVAHTAVTNVPGPREPFYLCGAKASLWMGSAFLVDGAGLVHTVNSYHNYLFFGFLSCRELMPDPDFYHQCVNQSFQETLKAAKKA